MGTRARVNIFEGNSVLVSIYRQFDGYPDGLGQEIADFAAKMVIVNGIPVGDPEMVAGKAANGIGCFAAQLIARLKCDSIGSVYVRNTDADSHGEEYSYNLHEKDGKIWMDVLSGGVTMFGCPGDTDAEMKSIFSGFAKDFAVKEDA